MVKNIDAHEKSTPDSGDESIYIVDGFDNIAGCSSRREMRVHGSLHRVTYLIVFNSAGQILVQERTAIKDWYPGCFDFAAGGVVQYGESYEQSAIRELREELGVDAEINQQFKMYFEDRNTNPETRSWGMVYTCICDGPFKLQVEEVAKVWFLSVDEALAMDSSLVTPDTRHALMAFLL